jgi:hypothetical protein
MSPISLSLDLLLMVLLMAALGFGWRLERRLKSLKDSHAEFAEAVAELDRAAQRAETGLAQLRQATDEAVELLGGRIEKARELTAKLDRLSHQAAAAAPRPANDAPRSDAVNRSSRDTPPIARPRVAPIAVTTPADAVEAAEQLARRLFNDDSLVLRQAPFAQPAARAVQPARSAIDDDLFDAPARTVASPARRRS